MVSPSCQLGSEPERESERTEVFKTFAANKHLSAGRAEPPADPDLRRLGVVSID